MRAKLRAMVSIGARLLVGAVMLLAGLTKFESPDVFLAAVHQYDLLPTRVAVLFAAVVPAVEIVVGATVILNIMRRGSLVVASLLLAVFAAAQAMALTRGLDISCGCFSLSGTGDLTAPHLVSFATLARALVLLAFTLLVLASSQRAPNSHADPTLLGTQQ